ncbi:MAG: hypothetical protein DRQ54_09355, partial [Gammaproteobacteria bacterium]
FAENSSIGGAIFNEADVTLVMENGIIAFTQLGPAMHCDGELIATITCTDIFSNDGGDWVDCLSGFEGADGNFSADPLFCDLEAGILTLHANSPCGELYSPAGCGLIGGLPVGCLETSYLLLPDGTGDYPDLVAAIGDAPSGSILSLGDGIYSGPGFVDLQVFNQNFIISSASSDATACIISCAGTISEPHRFMSVIPAKDLRSGTVTLREITIQDGYFDQGGAVYCQDASLIIEDCVLKNNGANQGGALYLSNAQSTLTGCTLALNSALIGSGIYCDTSQPTLQNSVIYGGLQGQAVYTVTVPDPIPECTVIFGNEGGDWTGSLTGLQNQNGNLWADPLFCDPVGGDFGLNLLSPCLPENNHCGVLMGALEQGCDPATIIAVPGDFATISAALAAAESGDLILIEAGIYPEHDINMVSGVALRAVDPIAGNVIFDAEGLGRVMLCDNLAGAVLIEGITFTGGVATGDASYNSGGGMLCEGTDIVLRNCSFVNNLAVNGGGLRIFDSPSVRVENCQFSDNEATGSGGGLQIAASLGTSVVGCTFTGNQSVERAGGLYLNGTDAAVNDCVFIANYCELRGGGANCYSSTSTFANCLFTDNSSGSSGGALFFSDASAPGTIISCTITGNSGTNYSSAIHNQANLITIENSIIAYGTGPQAAYCTTPGSFDISCSNVFGNEGGDYSDCLSSGEGINGNISADPLFCDAAAGDYHLQPESECQAANNTCGVTIGAQTGTCGDSTPPAAVAELKATCGFRKVTLEWTDATDIDLAGIEIYRARWHDNSGSSVYPEYDDHDEATIPIRPLTRDAAVRGDEWALAGIVPPGGEDFIDSVSERGVYYYELFAFDEDGNFSAPAADVVRTINYWLGDVAGPAGYDGKVDVADLTHLGTGYGSIPDDTEFYNAELDVGPTDDFTGRGIPVTDDYVGFDDLMVFGLNYGFAGPYRDPPVASDSTLRLAWVRTGQHSWTLRLAEPCPTLKGVRLTAVVPETPDIQVSGGELIEQQDDPVFLQNADRQGLNIGLAVMGHNVGWQGQGDLFTITLPPELAPDLLDAAELTIVVRDVTNNPLDYVLSEQEEVSAAPLPTYYRLGNNYPNPFNPMTKIAFELPKDQRVKLAIYDLRGRCVTVLVDETMPAGRHEAIWQGTGSRGEQVASGVYFYRLIAGSFTQTKAMTLVK